MDALWGIFHAYVHARATRAGGKTGAEGDSAAFTPPPLLKDADGVSSTSRSGSSCLEKEDVSRDALMSFAGSAGACLALCGAALPPLASAEECLALL